MHTRKMSIKPGGKKMVAKDYLFCAKSKRAKKNAAIGLSIQEQLLIGFQGNAACFQLVIDFIGEPQHIEKSRKSLSGALCQNIQQGWLARLSLRLLQPPCLGTRRPLAPCAQNGKPSSGNS